MSAEESIREYLSSLKEGDPIIRHAGGADLDKQRVSRITKTQIILVSGGRYNRTTGESIGSSTWNRTRIALPTPEIKRQWQSQFLARWAKNTLPDTFKALTPDQQLELFRHINAMAAANMSGEAQPAADEIL